jgi:acylphosphatase
VSRLHVEVRGRVQGVGFRWFVRERARALGLAGWVKNLADGAVEIAAAGPESAIDTLIAAVRVGPPGAEVSSVTPMPALPENELPTPFSIHR